MDLKTKTAQEAIEQIKILRNLKNFPILCATVYMLLQHTGSGLFSERLDETIKQRGMKFDKYTEKIAREAWDISKYKHNRKGKREEGIETDELYRLRHLQEKAKYFLYPHSSPNDILKKELKFKEYTYKKETIENMGNSFEERNKILLKESFKKYPFMTIAVFIWFFDDFGLMQDFKELKYYYSQFTNKLRKRTNSYLTKLFWHELARAYDTKTPLSAGLEEEAEELLDYYSKPFKDEEKIKKLREQYIEIFESDELLDIFKNVDSEKIKKSFQHFESKEFEDYITKNIAPKIDMEKWVSNKKYQNFGILGKDSLDIILQFLGRHTDKLTESSVYLQYASITEDLEYYFATFKKIYNVLKYKDDVLKVNTRYPHYNLIPVYDKIDLHRGTLLLKSPFVNEFPTIFRETLEFYLTQVFNLSRMFHPGKDYDKIRTEFFLESYFGQNFFYEDRGNTYTETELWFKILNTILPYWPDNMASIISEDELSYFLENDAHHFNFTNKKWRFDLMQQYLIDRNYPGLNYGFNSKGDKILRLLLVFIFQGYLSGSPDNIFRNITSLLQTKNKDGELIINQLVFVSNLMLNQIDVFFKSESEFSLEGELVYDNFMDGITYTYIEPWKLVRTSLNYLLTFISYFGNSPYFMKNDFNNKEEAIFEIHKAEISRYFKTSEKNINSVADIQTLVKNKF